MDAATIQSKIYAGYAKAALRVGYAFEVYRPSLGATPAVNPTAAGNLVATINAAFTPGQSGFSFERATAYKDVLFEGLYDGTQTEVGDYLVAQGGQGGQGTFFVAAMPSLQPILAVACNRVVTIFAPGPSQAFGQQSAYQGTTPADEAAVMTLWPVCMRYEARGRDKDVALPLNERSPNFTVMAPALASVDVRIGMVMTDDENRQYVISATELTPLGWRIFAEQAVT